MAGRLAHGASGRARLGGWVRRRRWPLATTALTLVAATYYTLYWGDDVQHAGQWDTPGDLWFTLRSAIAYSHGQFAAVYGPTNHLITFPGILVVLAPLAALMSAAHLAVGMPITLITYPAAWLVAGPYEILVGCTALFALDDVADRLGLAGRRRPALLLVQAAALWSVTVLWGHPEDALAVAMLLWGLLALHDGRHRRGGWLLGAAVATQPLVLLALPAVVLPVVAGRWRSAGRGDAVGTAVGLGLRTVLPSAVLLAGPLAASWSTTVRALTQQPNDAVIDHPTPWVHLAPALGHGMVASGPGRLVALAAAVGLGTALAVGHRRQPPLAATLWVVAVALALRCAFEPVLDAFYVWPALAVAVAVAGRAGTRWWRPAAASMVAVGLTAVSQQHWAHPLAWWLLVLAALGAVLAVGVPGAAATAADVPAPRRADGRPLLSVVRDPVGPPPAGPPPVGRRRMAADRV